MKKSSPAPYLVRTAPGEALIHPMVCEWITEGTGRATSWGAGASVRGDRGRRGTVDLIGLMIRLERLAFRNAAVGQDSYIGRLGTGKVGAGAIGG
jgi:hypothetical protein